MSENNFNINDGLPHSIEAEGTILGAVLLAPELLNQANELTPEDFYNPHHQTIFRVMRDLSESGAEINPVLIGEKIKREKLEAFGGVAAITNLTFGLPNFSDIESYVSIVREKSIERRAIKIFGEGIQEFGSGDASRAIQQKIAELTELSRRFNQSDDKATAPTLLPDDIAPAPELDEKLIPNSWREWLTDVAERMQCPLDYPTIAAIVSAAALVGSKIRIRPKRFDAWLVTPNLWGAIIGSPSFLKSPALKEGLFFFNEIAESERVKFAGEWKDYEFDKEFADAKQAEIKKQMRGEKANKETLKMKFQNLEIETPKENRLWTSDTTVEKLGELLNENKNGVLLLRDELTGWFRSLDKAGREQDRSFYLECWDGAGAFTFDRIGRGKIHINNLTLSILGTIQPAMLEPYLRGSLEGYGDDGLPQRFQMIIYPNKSKIYKFVDRLPKGRDAARASFKGLYELEPETIKARRLTEEYGGGYFVQFDNEAQEFFENWLTKLENYLRSDTSDSSAFQSHLAKYRSLMPTLSLIFHLIESVAGVTGEAVSLKNAQLAANWCFYLEQHARRIYGIVALSEFDVAREILKKIQSKDLQSEFTAKDIYGKHWAKLSKPRDVQNALEILVEYGYLTSVLIETSGRPKTIFLVKNTFENM